MRYAQAGLSESRAGILDTLDGQTVPATQTELAETLVISESSVCGLIEKMRQDGLLERERSLLDRRKTVLTLTPLGQQQCERVRQIHRRFEKEVNQLMNASGDQINVARMQSILTALGRLEIQGGEERRAA